MKAKRPNSKLLLVGSGNLTDEIKAYATELGISYDVMFLGLRSDIPELMQAMDCFTLPSLFEGLPVSGIEAQAAGLPCLFSDRITPEVCMTNYARLLPISDIDLWVDNLEKLPSENNAFQAQRILKSRGYDIITESEKLKKLYVSIISCTGEIK